MSDTEHVNWCRRQFNLLNDGGMWGVPRSGLLFQKTSTALILIDRMPYTEEMPITEQELLDYQQQDFELIQHMFGLAGIEITDSTK